MQGRAITAAGECLRLVSAHAGQARLALTLCGIIPTMRRRYYENHQFDRPWRNAGVC